MSEVECICTCARAPPFPYVANGWEDCIQIWCVARDPLDQSLRKSKVGCNCTWGISTIDRPRGYTITFLILMTFCPEGSLVP